MRHEKLLLYWKYSFQIQLEMISSLKMEGRILGLYGRDQFQLVGLKMSFKGGFLMIGSTCTPIPGQECRKNQQAQIWAWKVPWISDDANLNDDSFHCRPFNELNLYKIVYTFILISSWWMSFPFNKAHLPHKKPIPVGPQSLCAVATKKSAPVLWTSIFLCGAAWDPSSKTFAPYYKYSQAQNLAFWLHIAIFDYVPKGFL